MTEHNSRSDELVSENFGESLVHTKNTLPIKSDRAYRIWQVKRGIYVSIAKTMRQAARKWHLLVDGCAGARHKRGGVVECEKQHCVKGIGFYFKFTAEDAERLFAFSKEQEDE